MIIPKRKEEDVINENMININVPLQKPEEKIAIMEAAILDIYPGEELKPFLESTECRTLISMNMLSEKSIVKLDKAANRERAFSVAVLKLAKRANDKLFGKWVTVTKQKKLLFEKMCKKYKGPATREAKESMKKAKKK